MTARFLKFHHSDPISPPAASLTPRCWLTNAAPFSKHNCVALFVAGHNDIERRCCLVKDAFVIRNIRTQTPVLTKLSVLSSLHCPADGQRDPNLLVNLPKSRPAEQHRAPSTEGGNPQEGSG